MGIRGWPNWKVLCLDYCDGYHVEELESISWESWWCVEEHIGEATIRGELEFGVSN
jgi:hypothetical protein